MMIRNITNKGMLRAMMMLMLASMVSGSQTNNSNKNFACRTRRVDALVPPAQHIPTTSMGNCQDLIIPSADIHARAFLTVRGGGVGADLLSPLVSLIQYVESSKFRSWVLLFMSISGETMATTLIKMGRDNKSVGQLVKAFCLYFLSIGGFSIALKNIDLSIAYAVWAALGTAIVSVAGILLFGEACDARKIACLSMIILGVVGLNTAP